MSESRSKVISPRSAAQIGFPCLFPAFCIVFSSILIYYIHGRFYPNVSRSKKVKNLFYYLSQYFALPFLTLYLIINAIILVVTYFFCNKLYWVTGKDIVRRINRTFSCSWFRERYPNCCDCACFKNACIRKWLCMVCSCSKEPKNKIKIESKAIDLTENKQDSKKEKDTSKDKLCAAKGTKNNENDNKDNDYIGKLNDNNQNNLGRGGTEIFCPQSVKQKIDNCQIHLEVSEMEKDKKVDEEAKGKEVKVEKEQNLDNVDNAYSRPVVQKRRPDKSKIMNFLKSALVNQDEINPGYISLIAQVKNNVRKRKESNSHTTPNIYGEKKY